MGCERAVRGRGECVGEFQDESINMQHALVELACSSTLDGSECVEACEGFRCVTEASQQAL